jgi:hypothetical protein
VRDLAPAPDGRQQTSQKLHQRQGIADGLPGSRADASSASRPLELAQAVDCAAARPTRAVVGDRVPRCASWPNLARCWLVPIRAHALAIELGAIWSVWAVVLSVNQLGLIRRLEPVPAGVWLRTVAALVMSAFGICAGISLRFDSAGGLLWNLPANLIGVTIALFNAWNVTFAPEMLESVRGGEHSVPDRRPGSAC